MDFDSTFFEFQLINFRTNKPANKRRSCKRSALVKNGVPFLTLNPNTIHKYSVNCKSLISAHFKNIQMALYVIKLKLKMISFSAFPCPQYLYSDWSSAVLSLRPEDFDLEQEECTKKYPQRIILGRVPSPASFVYRLNNEL